MPESNFLFCKFRHKPLILSIHNSGEVVMFAFINSQWRGNAQAEIEATIGDFGGCRAGVAWGAGGARLGWKFKLQLQPIGGIRPCSW
jgi:hypothetical protein